MSLLDGQTVLYAVGAVFLMAAWRRKQFVWLSAVVLLGLAGWMLWGGVLGNWGTAAALNVYMLFFYIFLGSLFFFWNNTARIPDRSYYWRLHNGGRLLGYWALAAVAQYAALMLWILLIYWQYPKPFVAVWVVRLLQMAVWSPWPWVAVQAVLMAVFYGYARINGENRYAVFSLHSLSAGVLLALLCQAVEVSGMARLLPRLLHYWLS